MFLGKYHTPPKKIFSNFLYKVVEVRDPMNFLTSSTIFPLLYIHTPSDEVPGRRRGGWNPFRVPLSDQSRLGDKKETGFGGI